MTPLERLLIPSLRKRPNAILFDWDNTLFDQHGVAEEAYQHLIATLGRKDNPPTPDQVRDAWYNNGKEVCCREYFPDYTLEDVKDCFGRAMEKAPKKLLPNQEAVLEMLHEVHEKKIPMAIVSNKDEATLKEEIKQFGLTGYFQVIRGDRHTGGSKEKRARGHELKPHPAPILATLKEMKVGLGNAWFVGDSSDDAGAAELNGMQRFIIGEKNHLPVREKYESDSHDSFREDIYGGIIYLKDLAAFKEIISSIPPVHTHML